jgi:glycosyltransferase involved in cell wall biosynthesis
MCAWFRSDVRLLISNDGFQDPGGVQTYLEAIVPGLVSRGHDIAMLYLDHVPAMASPETSHALPHFSVGRDGLDQALAAVARWQPQICYSNNMSDLGVDRRLLAIAPVVKFMHGYSGTCVSGLKMFGLPVPKPCHRKFGAACVALYLPRRCGGLNVARIPGQYLWAREQQALFDRYSALVVASAHMKAEFVNNGADRRRVHVNPLFVSGTRLPREPGDEIPPSVVFLGRMTRLKGGDLLVRAVALASARLGTPVHLTVVGDGPERVTLERLASHLNVAATFTGWQNGEERWRWIQRASLLAVPSVWPEPFGLVGLEAAVLGVPAIAFDVGGIREWLTPGENGYLIPGDPPRASAFADGLVTAFREPVTLRAMGEKAWSIARCLSLDRHLDQLEEILARHGTLTACSPSALSPQP